MPHLAVKLLEGKSEKQKEQLAQALVRAAQEVIGFGEESYSVTIQEYSWEEWKKGVYPNDIMKEQDILYKKPGYTM